MSAGVISGACGRFFEQIEAQEQVPLIVNPLHAALEFRSRKVGLI
jgi:hypothetical protein